VRRREAFMEITSHLGMEVEEVVFNDESEDNDQFVLKLLDRPPAHRPTALACWNDHTAYELLANCRCHGIRVPEEVAIVGFDGCSTPCENVWTLTTIRAPWAEVARTAVLYLDALLKGGDVPHETVLPVELVVGNTI